MMEKVANILFYQDYDSNIRFHYDEHEKQLLFNSNFNSKQKENIINDYENYNFINLQELCRDVPEGIFENNVSFFREYYSGTSFPNVLVPNCLEEIIRDFRDSINVEKTRLFKKAIADVYTSTKSIKLSKKQESLLKVDLNDVNDKLEGIYDVMYGLIYANFIKFIVYEAQLETPEEYLMANSIYIKNKKSDKIGYFFSFDS